MVWWIWDLLRSGFDSQASLVVVSTRKWPQESNSGLSKAVGLVKKKGKGVTHGSYTPIQVDKRPKGPFLRPGKESRSVPAGQTLHKLNTRSWPDYILVTVPQEPNRPQRIFWGWEDNGRKGTSSYEESQSGSEVPQGNNKNSLAVLLV